MLFEVLWDKASAAGCGMCSSLLRMQRGFTAAVGAIASLLQSCAFRGVGTELSAWKLVLHIGPGDDHEPVATICSLGKTDRRALKAAAP